MAVCRRCLFVLVLVGLGASLTACAEPPTKELSQAEGAIVAARAAGAATYAADELSAAEQTLVRAHAEVAERDYRAALGHALDSSARAQAATTTAVEGRVKARLAADQTLDDLASLIEKVDAALATAEAKRVPSESRRVAVAAVAHALAGLQAARSAIERDDMATMKVVPAHTAALERAMASLIPPPSRKGRTRP